MRPFFAIVALTLKNALRSHLFQLLLLLLLLSVGIIPFSIGGGTAQDFIRVSLLYSIWTVVLILALSSLWLGCFVMGQDVETLQFFDAFEPNFRVILIDFFFLGKFSPIFFT